MDKKELAAMIEEAWMAYNAAAVSRLHPEETKRALANILINNVPDILNALRGEPVETGNVVTGDETPSPKKVRK